MRGFFKKTLSGKRIEAVSYPQLTSDIYENVLSQVFPNIPTTDPFFFVRHPNVKKEVLKVRTVCKLWNGILKKTLPFKRHLRIEKSCCNNEPAKGKLLEDNVTDSLFVNGFSNSLVLHLCVSHFTLELSEKFGSKITHMYLQSVDGIAGFLPKIVKNTKNLATLVLSDCYWIGRLALTSHTLTNFTLYKVVGLEVLQLKCRNLLNLVYNECNLSPLLSCENNLKLQVHCQTDLKILISSLYIEQVEISCEKAKSSLLEFQECCGGKIRVRSNHLTHLTFRSTKYGKIHTECPNLKTFQIEGVKTLKRLVLDSTDLSKVQLGKCVVKSLTCDTNIPPSPKMGTTIAVT